METRYIVGIDLGTTNSALAAFDSTQPEEAAHIEVQAVPQLVNPGEVEDRTLLPSFLFLPGELDFPKGSLALPWDKSPECVIGELARKRGAENPTRLIASAKSWLSYEAVNRSAPILPWQAPDEVPKLSPLEVSSRYLQYLRSVWDVRFTKKNPELVLSEQEILLAVPASFDEVARELRLRAAEQAGLKNVTLLEEPQAAFYAWIEAQGESWRKRVKVGDLILVCDVGGGTTDFTLIAVSEEQGELALRRVAVGDHILLGGDNVDLALARRIEAKLNHPKLTLRQQNALRRQCCAAKERLLSDGRLKRVPIGVLGGGRSLVGGALHTELTREEVEETLAQGFLPLTQPDDLPAREKRTGLRELGLPYATEAAITKHLAAFLMRSAESGERNRQEGAEQPAINRRALAKPDAILFNGGFFTPPVTRDRIVDAVANWFQNPKPQTPDPKLSSWRPKVLSNKSPEGAVAIGAAYYGHVRKHGGLRVSGGSARAYYIGVQTESAKPRTPNSGPQTPNSIPAVCVLPRETEEGTTLDLSGREFKVLANRPVSFTLYSSTTRQDAHGDLVPLNEEEVHRHAPLITVLRYGKRSRDAEIAVQLSTSFTGVGTLELWCESRTTDHRWRLQFQLRGAGEPVEVEVTEDVPDETQAVIPDETLAQAARLIRAVFGRPHDVIAGETISPETLTSRIESLFGYGKDAWPILTIRALADALADVSDGRKKSAKHEARWLNLYGFCLRPGFGAPADDWRVTQARKIYMAGLAFGKEFQCQVEWLVLWRRVAGGLNANQQHELYHKLRALLGLGQKKPARLNTQVERESWRLLASLEYLAAQNRAALGKELLTRIKGQPTNQSFLWSLGRLGARVPLYGPLNGVIPADVAADWIKQLMKLPVTPETASAVAHLGARTNDTLRDIDATLRERITSQLKEAGASENLMEGLREYVPPSRGDAARMFGESLPEGLRLVS